MQILAGTIVPVTCRSNPKGSCGSFNGRQAIQSWSCAHAIRWWLLIVILLLTAARVVAENRPGALTISPFAGGQGFPFGGATHYDGDFNYGVHLGYNFTERLGAELVFGINDTVHDPEAAFCRIYQYGGDVLYFFRPKKRVVPFVAAGFGVFDVKFDGGFDGAPPASGKSLADEINPYFNYGVGVDCALTRWLSFRADFREAVLLNSGDHAMQGVLGLRFQF